MALIKNYSQFHRVTYKDKEYIFDPYVMGQGFWKPVSPSGAPSPIPVSTALQQELNSIVFGMSVIPDLVERFKMADRNERENLAEIAKTWLSLKIKGIKGESQVAGMKTTTVFQSGGLYFYIYDPLYKDTLPMWDMFPLVIKLEDTKSGFLGLNLHYLDQDDRASFLDALLSSVSSHISKDLFRLNITYTLLKSLKNIQDYSPCIKKYRLDKIRSRILPIEEHEWAYAVWMNIQRFQFNRTK